MSLLCSMSRVCRGAHAFPTKVGVPKNPHGHSLNNALTLRLLVGDEATTDVKHCITKNTTSKGI